MAHREFRDEHGVRWEVWDTYPTLKIFGDAAAGVHLHEDAAGGWLTFQSARERRRFYQVPDGWESLPDDELRRLCRHAVHVETTGL
jgi:hypothetical protein